MPCYTERTVTVDLDVADRAMLIRGLEAAGFTVVERGATIQVGMGYRRAIIQGGKVQVTEGQEDLVNAIKVAYSQEATRTVAKRFGWTFKQDKQDASHVTLQRRAF